MHLIRTIWSHRISLFWPAWFAITAVAAFSAAWVVSSGGPGLADNAEAATRPSAPRRGRSLVRTAAAFSALALCVLSYMYLCFKWEDFAYYDDSIFTQFSLKGVAFPAPIWPAEGRFYPLGQQEFNLVRFFTHSAAGYHTFEMIELVFLCCVLLMLNQELTLLSRALLAAGALLPLSIVTSFTGLIYAERNIILFLGCFVLCVAQFDRKDQKVLWAALAVVCAQVVIYEKEPAFILIGGFALGRLLLRCRNKSRPGFDLRELRNRSSYLDVGLGALGVVFLLYYLAAMYPHPNMQYEVQRKLPLQELVLMYLRTDLLVWIFLGTALWRAYLIIQRRVAPDLIWDPLALGGVGYFLAYLLLRMFSAYYLAPADFIGALFVGRLLLLGWDRMSWETACAAVFAVVLVVAQQMSLTAFRMYERKNVMHAKIEVADLVEARYRSAPGSTLQLFFPFASPYVAMEFASYLDYRGLPVEEHTLRPDGAPGVLIVAKTLAQQGRCVDYRDLMCRAGTQPGHGDLVVMLPDDNVSLRDESQYGGGDVLFSCDPHSRFPRWLEPAVEYLRIASPLYRGGPVPETWLRASVALWK